MGSTTEHKDILQICIKCGKKNLSAILIVFVCSIVKLDLLISISSGNFEFEQKMFEPSISWSVLNGIFYV